MRQDRALKILGLSKDYDEKELKKKYRQVMHLVHPDAAQEAETPFLYEAHEVNEAYQSLRGGGTRGHLEKGGDRGEAGDRGGSRGKRQSAWNAPVNERAFRPREILQYAEDADGNRLGSFTLERGYYLWTVEEDFSLFLLSLYRLGKEILDEIDDGIHRPGREHLQAELTYLLAQQFIDITGTLRILGREEAGEDRQPVYFFRGALEKKMIGKDPAPGSTLIPGSVRDHRLYLKDMDGTELGYLSFDDDRFYYLVVPLFEQRLVQVKIRVAKEDRDEKRSRKNIGSKRLDLWLRLLPDEVKRAPESSNLQIAELLARYERS